MFNKQKYTARNLPRRCYVLPKEVTVAQNGVPNLPHKGLNKAFKQAFHKASPPLRANASDCAAALANKS